ncbi:MAG: DUF4129 domain-containing protein [Candidatus Kapabacteria bacterium]|nr:DUF4129 domain-containing protein [Candidatus Kapabacteria bacterium]
MKQLLYVFGFIVSLQFMNADTVQVDSTKASPQVVTDSLASYSPQERIVTIPKDTSLLEKKTFSEKAMNTYRASDDFIYNEDYSFTSALDKFFDTVKRYFIWLLEKLFGPLFAKNVFEALPNRDIVLYTITFVLLGLIIFFFYKSKLRFLFYKKSKKTSGLTFIEENIHEIDFVSEILNAEEQKKYRLAIRLQFLSLLKLLDSVDLIHWETQKTNREYVQELKNDEIRSEFEELVLIFEYVWYGEFTPNEEQYKKTVELFRVLQSKLQNFSTNVLQ